MQDVPQILVNATFAASVYVVVGLGFRLIYLPTRLFHFAYGVVISIGAYAAYVCLVRLSLTLVTAVVGGLAAATIIGIAIEVGIYEPLRKLYVGRVYLLLASLACLVIGTNVLAIGFGPEVLFLRQSSGRIFTLSTAAVSGIQVAIIALAVVIAALFAMLVKSTSFGELLRAIASDAALANVYGVNDRHVRIMAVALASATAGAIGALLAYDTGATPYLGFDVLLLGVVVALVGHTRPVIATILASIGVAVIEQVAVVVWTASFKQPVALALLLVIILAQRRGSDQRRARRVTP